MAIAPGPYAPPPYRQVGPGGTYFKVLPGIRGLQSAYLRGIRLYGQLASIPHPAARQKRLLLARHLTEMERRIKLAELAVAAATDRAVREAILATQVRPDNPSGPSMVKGIESRPLPYPAFPAFAVGLVDISILDKAATGASGKPYWPAQEFGYTGNVGRTIRGSFQPGNARPDPNQSRVHPIFSTGGGARFPMRIANPIQPRAFLRSGTMAGALMRQREWAKIERQGVAEVQRIITLGTPASRGRRP